MISALLYCLTAAALGQTEQDRSPDRYVKVKTIPQMLPASVPAEYRNVKAVTLLIDRINFGAQFEKPSDKDAHAQPDKDFSRFPGWYFHPMGPAGIVMKKFDWFAGEPNTFSADARLPASFLAQTQVAIGTSPLPASALVSLWSEPPYAVLGLDAGNLLVYARPMQTVHCFERVPLVLEHSDPAKGKAPVFTYVADARNRGARVEVHGGELRSGLEKRKVRGFYHVMFVQPHKDGENAVQKELLTKEGMDSLMSALTETGILCYHTSSRYYECPKVIADVADSLGYACKRGHDMPNPENRNEIVHFSSEWVMVARKADYMKHLVEPSGYKSFEAFWSVPTPTGTYKWVDGVKNSMKGAVRSDPQIGSMSSYVWDLQNYVMKLGFRHDQVQPWFEPLHGLFRSLGESVARNKDY